MRVTLMASDVAHCRVAPRVHRFDYPTVSMLCTFDNSGNDSTKGAESEGDWRLGYQRRALFSVHDRDYLFTPPTGQTDDRSIIAKLYQLLSEHGYSEKWARIELLTSPRFLGYVFNPVSFYLLYRASTEEAAQSSDSIHPTRPALCVAEVNNTFGERHVYIGEADQGNASHRVTKFRAPKDFHVSPFYDRSGDYVFYVTQSEEKIDVRVNLFKQGKLSFTSSIVARPISLVPANQAKATELIRLLYWGVTRCWTTLPRIVWQAARLKFQRKLKVYRKPVPTSVMTIGKRSPTLIETLSLNLVLRYLRQLQIGRLQLELPSGEMQQFGGTKADPSGRLVVRDWGFFPRVILGGDVAFGECYTEGLIESEDLPAVLSVFAVNAKYFNDRHIVWTKLQQTLNYIRHRSRANSRRGSRRNIRDHYDLGNELFERFLDGQLVYSCAVFDRPEESLEKAQLNKLTMMIDKAQIHSSHNILEIGSGWGAFAIEVAKRTGCRVTTITLSEEQLRVAKERVRAEGLEERVEVLLCDYREIVGSFDRIVSIEMLEAVGHEHLGQFFQICDRLLKPDGIVVLQFITMPDHLYDQYRKSCDWIQRYIFPGGHCPSLTAVCQAAAKHSEFVVEHLENIGPHYARTLREWRARFRERYQELKPLGYDERFRRMWEYYFAYCEAGFACRTLGTLQVVMARPQIKETGRTIGSEFIYERQSVGV